MSTNRLVAECAAYFRRDRGFQRAFEQMRKKWKSYGRCAGVVTLHDATKQEQAAIGKFFGTDYEGKVLRFTLAAWEAELSRTVFAGVSLLALLEAYFQESMESTKESRRKAITKLENFWEQLENLAQETKGNWALAWLQIMWEEKTSGYQVLLSMYKKNVQEAWKLAQGIIQALSIAEKYKQRMMHGEQMQRQIPLRLAVCAAQATGFPHALDYQQVAGKLFMQALCSIFNLTADNAEERIEVYYQAGLVADTLSSFTIGRGLVLWEKRDKEHPGYRIIRERNEICQLSLEILSSLAGADAVSKRVFVVENQMVFSQLCELCPDVKSVLLCTSGQCRTASLVLLDMLRDHGCEIWYSGDYDPEGLLIADKLVRRGKGQVHLWHYSAEEYIRYVSEHEIKAESMKMLERLQTEQLKEIAAAMMTNKKAAYQERFLDVLRQDIMNDGL